MKYLAIAIVVPAALAAVLYGYVTWLAWLVRFSLPVYLVGCAAPAFIVFGIGCAIAIAKDDKKGNP